MSKFTYCQPTMNITIINRNLLMNHKCEEHSTWPQSVLFCLLSSYQPPIHLLFWPCIVSNMVPYPQSKIWANDLWDVTKPFCNSKYAMSIFPWSLWKLYPRKIQSLISAWLIPYKTKLAISNKLKLFKIVPLLNHW